MSYHIQYQWAVFHVPRAALGLNEDRYIVAIESGDSNLYDHVTGRRTREWSACMVGTYQQVLRQTVGDASECESGYLKPHGRDCKPENYIRRIRGLLDNAGATPASGNWHACLRIETGHPAVAALRDLGLQVSTETRYGITDEVVRPGPEHYAAYFGLIDRYIEKLVPWCWIEVGGLPPSAY